MCCRERGGGLEDELSGYSAVMTFRAAPEISTKRVSSNLAELGLLRSAPNEIGIRMARGAPARV
jgi:hypothetical protein